MNTQLKTPKFFKLLYFVCLVIFGFLGKPLLAQNDNGIMDPNYQITVSNETYTELTSYTQLYGTADDGYSRIYVPFAFKWDTTVYPANFLLAVSPNGWVGFPGYYFYGSYQSGSISSNNPLTYSSTPTTGFVKTIHFLTGDNYVRTSLRYATLGSAPNRRFVVQWQGFSPISYSSNLSNFQLILYENGGADAGKMRMHWGTCNPYTQNNSNVCCLIGGRMERYINIQPQASGLTFYKGNSTNTYVTNATIGYLFSNGKCIDYELDLLPTLVAVYPTNGSTFIGNTVMDPSQRPGVTVKRSNASIPKPIMKYEIFNADGDIVYTTNNIAIDVVGTQRYNITSATGSRANSDGTFNLTGAPGGWYTVRVTFDNTETVETRTSSFFVDNKCATYIRSYPAPGTLLTSGVAVPVEERPSVVITKEWPVPIAPNPLVKYKILNDRGEAVYTALSNSGLSEFEVNVFGVNQRYYFSNAVGPFAGISGNLDLTNAPPGTYTIVVEFDDKVNPKVEIPTTQFYIIRTYDLILKDIIVPRGWLSTDTISADKYRYSYGAQFPVEFEVYNGGGVQIDSFKVDVDIYNSSNTLVTEFTNAFSLRNNPLLKTESRIYITATQINSSTLGVGLYKIVCTVTPLVPSQDEDLANNVFPRANSTRYFEIAQPIDVAINKTMAVPGSNTYRYPFYPTIEITNLGTEDLSGSMANIEIKHNGKVVYTGVVMLQNITFNTPSKIKFPEIFMPEEIGKYEVTLTLDLHGLPKVETFVFVVGDGLKGTYTIGAAGTYKTFNEAVEMLYLRGVGGNVVFELLDEEYVLGHNSALPEFRSKIVGVGPNATITFRPSQLRMLSFTPIRMVLESTDGYGIRFGQALETGDYKVPAVNIITDLDLRREFATSEGYITFDGGPRKNIKFVMYQPDNIKFSAPIYMGEGSKNITITNCRITGNNYNSSELPTVQYTNEALGFEFDNDIFVNKFDFYDTLTYSTGILIRNKPYKNNLIGIADYKVDTVATSNITIDGNIIEGFGYGIVSIGMGPIYQLNSGNVEIIYNRNNKFTNNYITKIAKAGIFLGFEDGAVISGNRIDSIGGLKKLNEEIYGIKLGGNYRYDNCFGYHNINVTVSENEISNIQSNLFSYGIKIEQHKLNIGYNSIGYSFPSEDNDVFKVYNNVINKLTTTKNASNCKVGIAVSTTRKVVDDIELDYEGPIYNNGNLEVYALYPFEESFKVTNSLINNNTISISEGEYDLNNNGRMIGILVQDVDYFEILNNAISIEGVANSLRENSAVALQGLNPKKLRSRLNHNAYYVTPLGLDFNSSYVRLYEMDEVGRFLEDGGYPNEYMKLTQWIGWTGEDVNSISGFDFKRDMQEQDVLLNGIKLYNVWRMKEKKHITRNSQLNNRAELITYIQKDLTGASRINLDQNPDIGAFEFDSEVYLTDMEVKMITAPAAYCDYRGRFADAEYVMVGGSAVDVKALIRNNGYVVVPNHPIRCEIYKNPNYTVPVKDTTVRITLAPGEEREVVFFSSMEESNLRFEPEPFNGEMPDKEWFMTMRTNVTPLYYIKVTADPNHVTDEYRPNDAMSKYVRFYVPSNSIDKLYLIISAENTTADLSENNLPNLNADIIAGKLNYDTLLAAFNNLKYFVATTEQKARHIDIMDRNGWEQRSIDYTVQRYNKGKGLYEPVYNNLFWADGDDKELTYWEKQSLIDFENAGVYNYKKNIVIASQEISRENLAGVNAFNTELNFDILRSKSKGDGFLGDEFVLADPPAYKIKGFYQAHNIVLDIKPTKYVPDNGPEPGIFAKIDTILGQNYVGYYYYNPNDIDADKDIENKMSLISNKKLNNNNIYGAFDWRHLGNATAFVAGVLDDIGDDLVVPVELVSFNANNIGRKVMLDWRTASEINTNCFEIERANVLNNGAGYGIFNNITTIKAAGNSNTTLDYNYTDRNVIYGESYAYRLKVTDIDGTYSYSGIREVTIENANGLRINEFSPNPANYVTKLNYNLAQDVSDLRISILDITGKEVSVVFNGSMNAGEHNISINVANLTSGVYSVLFNVDGVVVTKTLNIVK